MSVNGNGISVDDKTIGHNTERCARHRPMERTLWGEYEDVSTGPGTSEVDDAVKQEIIQNIIRKAMRPDSEPEPNLIESHYIEFPQNLLCSDSVVLHTVQLQVYARDVTKLIESLESGSDEKLSSVAPDLPPCVKKPESRKLHFPFVQMERDITDFAVGLAKPEPRLSSMNARLVLKKSVTTLLAHFGCHEAYDSVVDVLTDVTEGMLTQLGERLRVAVDQEVSTGQGGFNDALERAFTEMGLGTVEELLDHYQKNVVRFHERLYKKCLQLQSRYAALVQSRGHSRSLLEQEEDFRTGDEEMMEEEEEDEDVPEIHFPALDEEDQLGIQPSLEPGFQMLDSLEHDETLQNLDPDEEINVSDSPSQELMLSIISELSNSSDAKAKKKKKLHLN